MAKQKAKLPPIPKDSKIRQALGLGIGIWDYMEKNQKKFGDTFTLTLPGQGPMVWSSNQAVIKDTLRLKEDQYDASLVQLPIDVGEKNVVFQNGKEHQDARKLLIPHFTTERLKNRSHVMHEIVTEHINTWNPGDEFNIPRLVGDITLDIICFTLFDLREGGRKDRYKELILGWLTEGTSDKMFTIGSIVGTKKYRQFLNKRYRKQTAQGHIGNGKKSLIPWKLAVDYKVQLANMLREDIQDIRTLNNENEIHVLSILARTKDADGNLLDVERVISECVGMMVAGHETSAATAAWFFIWMQKKPEVLRKIADEVNNSIAEEGCYKASKVVDLPYLTASLNESQRLTPSAVGFIRWLKQDTQLGVYLLPAGSAILPNIYLTQRSKEIYGEDALEYRPERWLEGNKYSPTEFMPFGGGRRACVGMNQGKQQLKLIFSEIARRVEFTSEYQKLGKLPRSRMIGGQTEPENGVIATVKSVLPYEQQELSKSA